MARRTELPEGSLAAQILDAGDEPTKARQASRATLGSVREMSPESPAGVIMDLTAADKRVGLWAGAGVAVVLHVGVFAFAWTQFGQETEAKALVEDQTPMEISHVVDLDPPPSAQPEPAPKPAPPPEPAEAPPAEPPEAAPSEPELAEVAEPAEQPPAPAEAGEVVTAAPEAGEIADFTDFDITTGEGESYAGGVTASDGTNKSAVHSGSVDRDGSPSDAEVAKPPQNLARSPRPKSNQWDCPWPEKADALSIDRQKVPLRAVVNTDGTLKSVEILSDPGFGFGEAARRCASSQSFLPALDEQGHPYPVTAPITVEFERE